MKKLIPTFLKVGFILSLVCLIAGPVVTVIGIIMLFTEHPDTRLLGYGIYMTIAGLFSVIVLTRVRATWPTITKKEDVIPVAVWSIVAGAILTGFPIVSGILMLVMPADQYGKNE